jgi:uncharacterized membrane protein YGL010W
MKQPQLVTKHTIPFFTFGIEVILYAIVFMALDSASIESAFKAAVVLAIALRIFYKLLNSNKLKS